MRARLSDGYSYAVEFTATQRTFNRAIARALLEYAAKRGGRWRGRPDAHAQVHVYVSPGNWASADFPRSNAPVYVRLGHPLPDGLYARCVRAGDRAAYVERGLSGLAAFACAPPAAVRPALRLVTDARGQP